MTHEKLYFFYGNVDSGTFHKLQKKTSIDFRGKILGSGYISDYEVKPSAFGLTIERKLGAQAWGNVIAFSDDSIKVLEEGILKNYQTGSVEVEVYLHNEKPPVFLQATVYIAESVPVFGEMLVEAFPIIKDCLDWLSRKLSKVGI